MQKTASSTKDFLVLKQAQEGGNSSGQKEYDSYIEKYGSSSISKHLRIKEKKIILLNPLKTNEGVSEVKKTNIVFSLPSARATALENQFCWLRCEEG